MKSISLKCPAKINLSLDVVGKMDNGYHELKMIMQTVDLFDIVSVKVSDGDGIFLSSNKEYVPCDNTNTCYRAAELFYKRLGKIKKVEINIEKNIPQGAGMAGGSADAAGVLRALNELENYPFLDVELKKIGKKVGADVPFCINGGCCLCEGIGEILTPVPPMKNVFLVIVKPEFSVSTVWVYKNLVLSENCPHPDIEKLLIALQNEEYSAFKTCAKNTLEAVTAQKYPEIEEIKEKLLEFGALYSMMTGSGPTVFGIFEKKNDAVLSYNYYKEIYNEVHLISL